jgi:hypothetical protein
MNPPIDKQAATMQANLLRLYARLPNDPGLARVAWRTVANPQASPDTLLILADAIRDPTEARLQAIADDIATLAPSRAASCAKET